MEPVTPPRIQRELVCPNTPIKRKIYNYTIRTLELINPIDNLFDIFKDDNYDIVSVKELPSSENENEIRKRYYIVNCKMMKEDFRDWINNFNNENIQTRFEYVIN